MSSHVLEELRAERAHRTYEGYASGLVSKRGWVPRDVLGRDGMGQASGGVAFGDVPLGVKKFCLGKYSFC